VKHCHGREILYFFRYEPQVPNVVLVPIDTWSNLEFSAAIESLIRGSIYTFLIHNDHVILPLCIFQIATTPIRKQSTQR
jgi:hypothetical protein